MTASPTHDLLQQGLALHRRGAVAEAAARYAEVLGVDAANADAHYYLAMISCQAGRFAEGAELARKSLANDPQHARAHVLLGRALSALGQHDEALANFDRAIALMPDLAEAHSNRANVLSDLGRDAEAIDSYDRALALAPDSVEDWFDRGLALIAVGRHDDAIASFARAIAGKPDFAQAHLCRGKALFALRRFEDASEAVDAALAIEPNLAEAWLGCGNVLTELRRYDEAFAAYDRALALQHDLAEAWIGRGNVLLKFKRYDESPAAHDKALALNRDLAAAWLGRGNVFTKLRRFGDAVAAYDKARVLKPDLAPAWLGCGNVFTELGRQQDGLAAYDKALALQPDLAEAWLGRGNVFANLKRYDEAFAAYDRAVALQPDLKYAAGARLHAKQFLCDWTNLEAETAQILTMLREGMPAAVPFIILAIASSPADQLQCARRYVQDQPSFPQIWRGEIYCHDRVRVAYLSADFREHPMGYLTVGLFEQHDKSRFDITGISFGPNANSHTRHRIESAVEHWVDGQHQSDQDIADLIRRLEIDIVVDLMGFTANNRFGVLARRPAPIEVNYLGYPGTLGTSHADYILADPTIIPEQQCAFYAEQVVWLPDCYQINDNKRRIREPMPSRRECGLPDTAFVFCCFNNTFKITPAMFDIWMRLLQATDNSVLWLFEGNSSSSAKLCRDNLCREAEQRGVSSQRLIFAPKLAVADHLSRHRHADLLLDTLPYNAHTTASDALWTGVPVLTCLGATFAGRVAASLLNAIGLDELITHSLEEYEALALKLAWEPSYLTSLKDKLARNRMTAPLFDTERTTRQIEAAYTMMWQRYQRGEAPRASTHDVSAAPIRVV